MKVIITPECHAQIMYYVHKSKVEISGLGRVQKASDGTLVVTSIYLLRQENAAASTDLDQEAVATLQYESRADKGDLNFWWHSHVEMGVFWSGTDMATIKEFGSKGYLLSTVFNKKNEHRTSLFRAGDDFYPEMFIDSIPTHFGYTPSEAQIKAWEENFTKLCTTKVYAPVHSLAARRWDKRTNTWAYERDDMVKGHLDSFNDPLYWQAEDAGYTPKKGTETKPSETKPSETKQLKNTYLDQVVGESTGYTARDMVREIWLIRKAKPIHYSELDMITTMMLYDLFEILYGFSLDGDENEIREIEELFTNIIDSVSSCQEIVDRFYEELPFYIENCIDGNVDAKGVAHV